MDKPLIFQYVYRLAGRRVAFVKIVCSLGFESGFSELVVQRSTDWATARACVCIYLYTYNDNCIIYYDCVCVVWCVCYMI